jgi:hypothetical protein
VEIVQSARCGTPFIAVVSKVRAIAHGITIATVMRNEDLKARTGVRRCGGHRCAGEELVKIVIRTFIAWFVRNHDWTFPPQDTSPGPGGLGPLPRGGLRMQIRKRAR